MARPNLTALLDSKPKSTRSTSEAAPEVAAEAPTETAAPEAAAIPAAAPTPAAKAPTRKARQPKSAAAALPVEPERFSELTRKESRFREDQIDDLAAVAKRLMRARTEGGPRITDNTIIRVAVDLLLSRADELHGNNEAELRASLMGE